MSDLPYWADDPLLDRSTHRLDLQLEPVASAQAGRDLYVGTCSCHNMPATPAWDDYAVMEAFDLHMGQIQQVLHTFGPNVG